MLRSVLLAALAALALPHAAQAAVLPSVSSDTLTVTGDGAADQVALRLAPGSPGSLQVVTGNGTFTFSRSAFSKIAVRPGGGADAVSIDESAGAFTDEAVTIETGAGADTVSGGSGAELIATGDDVDLVSGGGGDDTILLGAGDDTAIQSEGSDTVDGQAGTDTLQAVGTSQSEEFTVQAVGALARIARDTVPSTTDSAAIEVLDVNAAGGPDLVDVGDLAPTDVQTVQADLGFLDAARDQVAVQGSNGIDFVDTRIDVGDGARVDGLPGNVRLRVANPRAADDRLTIQTLGGIDFIDTDNLVGSRIALTLDGGAGADSIDGSEGPDVLRGGPDADVVSGGRGADVVDLGDGDDRFHTGPQDGNDRVEGGAGHDEVVTAGTAQDESMSVVALGSLARVLTQFSGSLDLTGTEAVTLGPMTGTDHVTVDDLTGTAVKTVTADLSTNDLRVDTVTAIGSQGPETIRATTGTLNGVPAQTITGLAATVHVRDPERGEKVAIDARDGADTIDASGVERDKIQPILRGGHGNDTIIGTPGDDEVSGGVGTDLAFMGGGLDTFKWAVGDGSDIVEGQGGTDFLQMDGSAANERFDVTGIGTRTRVTRDVENVSVDLGRVERLDIMPAGGGDTMRVADMSGTDTTHVSFELAIARGTTFSDQTSDSVFVDGTNGNDAIGVTAAGPQVRVTGTPAIVTTTRSDAALDKLHVDTKAGIDSFTVGPNVAQLIGVTSS